MAKKILFVNVNGQVVKSTVLLSDNITVDHSTIYVDDKPVINYNDFIYLIMATEEEIQKEIERNFKETSMFQTEDPEDPIDPDLKSYNVGLQELIDYNRGLLIKKFSTENELLIKQGFYSNSLDAFFGFGDKDQANFNQKMTMKLLNPSDDSMIYWKSEDKGIIPLSRSQFITLVTESGKHKEDLIGSYWQKKTMIESNYKTLLSLLDLKGKNLGDL